MNKLLKDSKLFLKNNASTILTCVGGIGVIATAVIAVKETPKAIILIDAAEKEKGESLTRFEIVKAAGPVYIPAILVGTATISCIFGANILNKRNQAALMSAYALLDNSYKEYKNKTIELYGEDVDKHIRSEIAKGKYEVMDNDEEDDKKLLFYDQVSNRYFRATKEDVLMAEYSINKLLAEDNYASLNEFYELLNLEKIEYGDNIGWSAAKIFETNWSSWINFSHETFETDDGLEVIIICFTEPIMDFKDY